MPNKVNFAFDYYMCCLLVMLIYVPGEARLLACTLC